MHLNSYYINLNNTITALDLATFWKNSLSKAPGWRLALVILFLRWCVGGVLYCISVAVTHSIYILDCDDDFDHATVFRYWWISELSVVIFLILESVYKIYRLATAVLRWITGIWASTKMWSSFFFTFIFVVIV